jgi:hypothetical protein
MYLDENETLHVFIVSDEILERLNCVFELQMFILSENNVAPFDPIYSLAQTIPRIAGLSSFEVDLKTTPRHHGNSNFLISTFLRDSSNQSIAPQAILLPDKLYQKFGKAELAYFTKLDDLNYRLGIKASNVLPLVWVDLADDFKAREKEVIFHFDDNGFSMMTPNRTVVLHLFSNPKGVVIFEHDIRIQTL